MKQEFPWKETKVSGSGEKILINALREIVQDKTGRGLILLASRGSGKTVASYRCEHLLANASTSQEIFGGSRPLVFRWAKANWPTTTADNLIDLVSADSKLRDFLRKKTGLSDVSRLCRSLAEYAFDEERLVVIVDAYDELDEKQKASLRTVHAQTLEEGKKVLWIITSRDYAVNEEKDTFFKEDVFRRLRLQPFSRELQNQFMERALSPMVKSWREDCFKDSDEDWDKQLGTPLTLRQVAVMINESKSTHSQMPSFSSLSDLFVQSSDRLIDREFTERNLPLEKSRIDGRSLTEPLRREYLERALGAIAFELAVRGIWKEVIGTTDQITEVIGEGRKRFLLGFKESNLDARHNADRSWEWA
ncbi:MAG: NACHT domain-containing protein, partial [Pirellula sp.]